MLDAHRQSGRGCCVYPRRKEKLLALEAVSSLIVCHNEQQQRLDVATLKWLLRVHGQFLVHTGA